jgi:outer membrane protein assembly factor BamB
MFQEKLTFFCLNAETGKLIWRSAFPEITEPMATPAVDGDRVYGLSKGGTLLCLRASNGRRLWQKNLESDFHAEGQYYRWATSPVVDGQLLLLNVNDAGMALNKMTGDIAWTSPAKPSGIPASYGYCATPVLCDFAGTRCALFFGPSELSAVDIETGRNLWSCTHYESLHPLSDPIVFGNQVVIAQPISMLLEMAPRKPRVVWGIMELLTGLSTAVLVDGYLYGMHQERSVPNRAWDVWLGLDVPLCCVELKTGKVMWEKTMHTVSLTAANGNLIMLESNGTLRIAKATTIGYSELSSADVLGGRHKPRQFPSPPVLCGGRIYCRNYAGDLVCIDVRS